MKTRWILILSVFLNAGLLAALVATRRPAEPTTAPGTDAGHGPSRTVTRVVPGAPTPAPAAVVNPLDWTSIESEDYRQYIANMRAAKVPEETIRDIIIADVNKLYAAKIAALRPSPADFKFWKTRDREMRDAERQRRQKERELLAEKRALIKELLGVDLETEMARQTGEVDRDSFRYGWLSPEKQEQVRELLDKYREQERAIFAEGGFSPENRAKLMALRAQQEAELASILTPAEFEEYQLRNSWTARNMRENLAAFQPTEREFREIFKLQKAFDDQFGMWRGGGDESFWQAREQAQQALEEQLRAILGDQRYQEYVLSQDPRYRDIFDFAQNNNLAADTAKKIYEVRMAAEAERQRIQNDASIPAEQRQAQLALVANQAKQALGTLLGPDTLNAYVQSEGRWLSRLESGSSGGRQGFGGGGPPPGRGFRGRRG
ncbi:MAG: hypothetical protein N3I86_11105 [Verrucomicrobiae bacterium]|nr:hypothetical protein [Verrucomicrobiae bacterium]